MIYDMIDVATFGGIDFHAKTGLCSCASKKRGFRPFKLKQKLDGPRRACALWKEPRFSRRGDFIVRILLKQPRTEPVLNYWIGRMTRWVDLLIIANGYDAIVVDQQAHWIVHEIADQAQATKLTLDQSEYTQPENPVFFTAVINRDWKRRIEMIDREIRLKFSPEYDVIALFNTR